MLPGVPLETLKTAGKQWQVYENWVWKLGFYLVNFTETEVVGSNPQLSRLILGLKNDLFLSKSQKNICICTKLIPKAKKFKKWKIYSEPLQDTASDSWHYAEPHFIQSMGQSILLHLKNMIAWRTLSFPLLLFSPFDDRKCIKNKYNF